MELLTPLLLCDYIAQCSHQKRKIYFFCIKPRQTSLSRQSDSNQHHPVLQLPAEPYATLLRFNTATFQVLKQVPRLHNTPALERSTRSPMNRLAAPLPCLPNMNQQDSVCQTLAQKNGLPATLRPPWQDETSDAHPQLKACAVLSQPIHQLHLNSAFVRQCRIPFTAPPKKNIKSSR